MHSNVWFVKIRTTHNLSLWLNECFWIILLYGHLGHFILKVLAWKISNMKFGFAQKVKIRSQRQFMYGSNFNGSDVVYKYLANIYINFWNSTFSFYENKVLFTEPFQAILTSWRSYRHCFKNNWTSVFSFSVIDLELLDFILNQSTLIPVSSGHFQVFNPTW